MVGGGFLRGGEVLHRFITPDTYWSGGDGGWAAASLRGGGGTRGTHPVVHEVKGTGWTAEGGMLAKGGRALVNRSKPLGLKDVREADWDLVSPENMRSE